MRALVLANGKVEYTRSYPEPKPESDELLIAVELAGICATDLESARSRVCWDGG